MWGSTGTGLAKGDPISGDLQAIGIQPSLKQLTEDCRVGGGVARGGAVDVCVAAPPENAFPTVEKFAKEIMERCGLSLKWTKSQVYVKEVELPDYSTPGLKLAGEQVGDRFLHGLELFRVPIGSPEFIKHKVKLLKNKIVADAKRIREVLSTNRQALWSALSLSVQQRFQY